MNPKRPGTRDRVLAAALELFSVNGYETVSVRDIGRAVGIKESSIYYHFTNKEDILETLLHSAEEWTKQKREGFVEALDSVPSVERLPFLKAGAMYIEGYLLNEPIRKLLRMLTIEKQRNGRAAALYRALLFETPLRHHEAVFRSMLERGLMKPESPEWLAAEYQAIILYVYQKYYSGTAETEGNHAPAGQELDALLGRFYERYIHGEVHEDEAVQNGQGTR